MSVLIVTSLGDIVVDLHTDRCSLTTKNFLKLCKIKYFNGCLFHTVQKDFTAQTGDPTGTGTGGDSLYKLLYGDQARFFKDEIHPILKHSKTGTVAMASAGENLNASQFYFTLRGDLDYLDGKHTVFGEVAEGLDTLMRINEAYVDDKGRPYKNIRIKHTYVLDDPFDDPPTLAELIPDGSPEGKPADEMEGVRLEDDWVPIDEQLGPGELEEALRVKEAKSNAVFLESVGDIPDAEIKPPDNVLFVCKLNPVTQDEDLDTIFSRFGDVLSAEVIRDYKTGDSLCYAFIEFENKEACELAYYKMDNALIDDRRIHVDFSQSVSKLWSQYRRGKGSQTSRGKGCFKCGALDHIAKDCTEGTNSKQQHTKYVLKDENAQRGGDIRQSYEMVFGDTSGTEDDTKKWKRDDRSSEDLQRQDHDRRDPTSGRHRHDERSRGRREEERGQGNKGSRRDENYYRDHTARERVREKHEQQKEDENHHKNNERDGRKRSIEHDGDLHRRDDRGDRRSKGHNSEPHKMDERDDKKRSKGRDDNPWSGDEQDDRKRSIEHDGDLHRRDDRGDRRSKDHNSEPHKMDERDDTKRSKGRDDNPQRGDEQDNRKRSIGHESKPHRMDERNDKRSVDHNGDTFTRDGRDDRKRRMDHDSDLHRRDERDDKKRNKDRDCDPYSDRKHRNARR